MKRLLSIEWAKFKNNTVLRLLLSFFVLFFPACMYFGSRIPELPSFLPNKNTFFQFPAIWEYLGYAGNWMVFFFLGVIAIYFVTIEVSNKTMRQSIINGLTRKEFFVSKILSVVIICILGTVLYMILAIIIGLFNGDEFNFSAMFDNDWAVARFFLMSLGYTLFALFLAFLFRKSGLAIFFYISYIMIIEPLIRLIITVNVDKAFYINYFPMNATEDLMPLPAMKYADAVPNYVDYAFLLTYQQATITTLVYSILFVASSYYMFQKRDI